MTTQGEKDERKELKHMLRRIWQYIVPLRVCMFAARRFTHFAIVSKNGHYYNAWNLEKDTFLIVKVREVGKRPNP